MLTVRNDRSIRALVIGFLLLLLAICSTIFVSFQHRQAFALVEEGMNVEMRLASILSRLQDAETGQRGYLLTGDERFLDPYRSAEHYLPKDLIILHRLLGDRADQHDDLTALEEAARQRQGWLGVMIRNREVGRPVDRENLYRGKQMMDDVRLIIRAMQKREQERLQQRKEQLDWQWIYVIIGLAISTLILLVLGIMAQRHARGLVIDLAASRDAHIATNKRLVEEARQREASEAQLRQMQKTEAIGQLTGGIAHDFNNMLAVVIGSLEIAMRRGGDLLTRQVRQPIDNAMEGAQRAAQLTARLLAFSRQQPLEPQPLILNKLVGGLADLLHRTLGDHVKVETVMAAGLWRCFADPGQLESAILNLSVNARDAMPAGGHLTIETANSFLDEDYAREHNEVQAGQYVMLSVTDTGSGMAPDVVERAFDPFFTTKDVGKGTGLGLSQVFGFVKQSGGHVKIYSEVGEGTTIRLYLPRHYGEGEVSERSEPLPSEPLARAKDGECILLVEDEERVRMVSLEALRELGYRVLAASDAASAHAIAANEPNIDLLFTDIIMPEVNGRKLAEQMEAARPGLKVLYTTGYTRNAIVHNGMLDPGLHFIAKPFTIDQLARKVRQVLDTD